MKILKIICSRLYLLLLLYSTAHIGQGINHSDSGPVYVDDSGILRWKRNKEEVHGFGVNYTLPFAHAYRSAKKFGIDPKRAIDEDVYHFSRLGFDLYRVHVWDTEISDSLGNLISNDHLNTLDYLLMKLQERKINYVLTPIAYWGNGWPEPDEKTPGFSARYGKEGSLTNPEAIKAQERYLSQFMLHKNAYTGIVMKDDPNLIAIEISNEPHHRGTGSEVTSFIERMVEAVKKSGYKNPVLYNITHSVQLMDDYFKAGINGGTFQWYPTGLGYQNELQGNFLPNVDQYVIPFEPVIRKYKGAKTVYEFDAADINRSYIYPAMARSFRASGIQIATHFSYDPMFLAFANTEYNTHYMNLAFTPGKALSLMISKEIFHSVPLYKDYGKYPENAFFDNFSVSYEKDLAMLNGPEKYFYTNSTNLQPKELKKIREIAGTGNSPVITYTGTGAYFLDQLEKGVWRLEVMPDVCLVENPFGRNSLQKEVSVIQWNSRNMEIRLPDLGSEFVINPLNEGNTYKTTAIQGEFVIRPGSYLVYGKETKHDRKAGDTWENMRLNEFHAPESTVEKTYLMHEASELAFAGENLRIEARMINPDPEAKVQLQITGSNSWNLLEMNREDGFVYSVEIPKELIKQGFLTYYIYVKSDQKVETFPAGKTGLPYDWDFINNEPYRVRIISKEQPVQLFDAEKDVSALSFTRWSKDSKLVPTDQLGASEYQIRIDELFVEDPENLLGPVIYDYSIKCYVKDRIKSISPFLTDRKTVVLKARSLSGSPEKIQLALIDKQGVAFGTFLDLGTTLKEYSIPINQLKIVNTVILPRPYPSFLPYSYQVKKGNLRLEDIESMILSIGPGLGETDLHRPHGIGIVSIHLGGFP